MEKIFVEYNSEILENTIGEIGVIFIESSNMEKYISLFGTFQGWKCLRSSMC